MSAPLFYCGGNVGLGNSAHQCFFIVEENGTRAEWSIAATLARIGEFSEPAKLRILADCSTQSRNNRAMNKRKASERAA